jgi:hypothetical protein
VGNEAKRNAVAAPLRSLAPHQHAQHTRRLALGYSPICPATGAPHSPPKQNARARREGRLAPVAKRELADFKDEGCHAAWDIRAVGREEAGGRPLGGKALCGSNSRIHGWSSPVM